MHSALTRLANRPFGPIASAGAWLLATGVLLGMLYMFGGPYVADSNEVDVPAYALAEGAAHCAYPPDLNTQAPLVYPLIAAGFVAIIGEPAVRPFPSGTPGCQKMGVRISQWQFSWTHRRILWAGLFGWFFLLAGFVAVLRAAGRGRNGWEAISVVLLALVPQVAVTLAGFFHPEDLVALGFIFGGLATLGRKRWVLAGVLFGLALMTKQYALLVVVPAVIAVPPRGRLRFIGAVVGVVAVLVIAMVALSGWVALSDLLGSRGTPLNVGTLVDLTKLQSVPLVLVARLLPVLSAGLVAIYGRRRLGDRVLEPGPLVALAAVGLALRLVFEVSFFDYYLVCLAVTLLLLDCCRRRIRLVTIAWILGSFYLVPSPIEIYSPIIYRVPVLVQALVSLSGLAIAATSFWRACEGPPEIPTASVTPAPQHTAGEASPG